MATEAARAHLATKWLDAFSRLNGDQPGISGLLEFSEAWTIASEYLRPRNITQESKPVVSMSMVKKAFDTVTKRRRIAPLIEGYLEGVKNNFHLIHREINEYLAEFKESQSARVVERLIRRIFEWYTAWAPIDEFGMTIRSSYALAFQTNLFALLTPDFVAAFKVLCASTLPGASSELSTPASQDSDTDYFALWEQIEILGLLDRYEGVIASVGYEHIEEHISRICAGEWTESVLDGLRAWLADKMFKWMVLMYARDAKNKEDVRIMLANVGSRFDFHVAKTLCNLRTSEIFDIIIDFPDSTPAILDLKECMVKVDGRAALVQTLRRLNRKRLLHPGADTRLILTQYVSIIKCLRLVDPVGVLLYKVADPIRRYLRDRPDTIRCIVTDLVRGAGGGAGEDGDGEDSLVDENEPIQPLQQQEVDNYTDPNWEPEPKDAGPNFRASKPSDIISTLVSIYDSKELFVKEVQVLLAQRLIAIEDNEDTERVERERRTIEILKIRFGEAALQVCEVMLKDMTDSKRIDTHVQSQKPSVVHPTIISRQFWPLVEVKGSMVMPGQLHKIQRSYAREFTTFKPDKKLLWLPHLGTVKLELELEDRTVEVEVTPLEAAFVELFSTRPRWSIDELIKETGTSVNRVTARKALLTWVEHGVLTEVEEQGVYRLLEVAEERQEGATTTTMVTDEDDDSAAAGPKEQAEQMRIYWKFIEGMLRSLQALPVDRIQGMLKQFAPGYDQSVEQLGMFMEAARSEGLVIVRDGLWKLK